MDSWPLQASGIIMSTASGSGRPAITRNSSTLSKMAESLPPSMTMGTIFLRSSPRSAERQIGGRPADEDLPEDGLDGTGGRRHRGVVGRHIAPPEHALSLFGHDLFEDGLALCTLAWVPGEEHESGAVVTRRGQGDAEPAALAEQEGMGHLDQDAGAVPRIDLAAAGPAVQQVLQHGEH